MEKNIKELVVKHGDLGHYWKRMTIKMTFMRLIEIWRGHYDWKICIPVAKPYMLGGKALVISKIEKIWTSY
jgi:hypothetical protein